ncbi:MAG: DHH family phosphoesterase [bacterium]|nr:DHH family phosphoesterase [bacterium]
MLDLPTPQVICVHESDLDGFVSGLLLQRLARKLHGQEVRLEACHNHTWRQRVMSEKAAWVADFTFDPRLDRAGWLVVDHHPTETRPQRARLLHDPAKSAGRLCYELCQEQGLGSPALDRLVHLSDVADLFLADDPDFDLAGDYGNLVKCYGFWNLHALVAGELERVLDHPLLEVMQVKRRVEDPLGYAWSRQNIIEVAPGIGYVDTVVGNANLIIHRLLRDEATPHRVLLTLFRKGNGTIIASLRSRHGEALPVATRLQGGGHPNASGATLPRSVNRIDDALIYLRQTLNPAPASPADLASLESLFAKP